MLKLGDSFEEGSYDTEEESEEFADLGEEEEDYEDEQDTDEEGDYEDEEGFSDSEEGEEAYEGEGEEDMDGETEKKGGISGFFSRLFGGDSEEEEYTDEGEEFEEGGGEEYAEESGMEEDIYSNPLGEEEQEEGISQTKNDSSAETEENTSASQETVTPEPEEKPSFIPLNKILKTAYRKSGYLVNAVYIARDNENLETISQKIYGSDRVSELSVLNSHLQSRSVKVGDKIYYNSPLRPADSSKLLFYYEDIQASSSSYMLSPGENIRKVASRLLGHPNSWKEIWATNPELESKGEVSRSINIVYWPKNTMATQAVPSSEPEMPVSEPVTESVTEPSTSDNLNLEAGQGEGFSQPKSSAEADKPAQFPEPPPIQKKSKPGLLQVILQQKEVTLGLIAVIVMLVLMIRLILKKRKQRDFDYTATNIEV